MMRKLAILGSTGSIGRQALDVVSRYPDRFSVYSLAAHASAEALFEQVRAFHPERAGLVCVPEKLPGDVKDMCAWRFGEDVCSWAVEGADDALAAVVGIAGLPSALEALEKCERLLLANKEALVTGGELVMEEAHDFGAEILPVDSEHSALFQSLQGNRDRGEVKRLILTCSGGPFFGKTTEELQHVTREDALHNPNWSMGAKITVDSASLMNKGLEVIEAMHLYHMPAEKVSIVVHRESIIHSLVEYCDNAMIAQLGSADMRLPIQYALTWPRRVPGPAKELDLWNCGPLTFAHPDLDTFRCLKLALDAARTGGTAGAILNGANEAAVAQFLAGKIRFLEIADKVQRAMETVPVIQNPSLTQVLEADAAAREAAR